MKIPKRILVLLFLAAAIPAQARENPASSKPDTLKVLFIGNSYTGRHHQAELVTSLAEAGHPGLHFDATTVIYGGRRLRDHWRLGTHHVVDRHAVTEAEVAAQIQSLEVALAEDPEDNYASRGLARMKALLADIRDGTLDRSRWDWIVLQSYRDDLEGEQSLYVEYAPRFAELAAAQGARVLLYETTPTTQNAFPLERPPEAGPILEKAETLSRLAKTTGSAIAPMSYVAWRCQTLDPSITLRFENDPHLNQVLAYLTACTIYAALFERSPVGLPVDSVTDIRFWQNDRKSGLDRDGKPITRVFTEAERQFFQTVAWDAWREYRERFL